MLWLPPLALLSRSSLRNHSFPRVGRRKSPPPLPISSCLPFLADKRQTSSSNRAMPARRDICQPDVSHIGGVNRPKRTAPSCGARAATISVLEEGSQAHQSGYDLLTASWRMLLTAHSSGAIIRPLYIRTAEMKPTRGPLGVEPLSEPLSLCCAH